MDNDDGKMRAGEGGNSFSKGSLSSCLLLVLPSLLTVLIMAVVLANLSICKIVEGQTIWERCEEKRELVRESGKNDDGEGQEHSQWLVESDIKETEDISERKKILILNSHSSLQLQLIRTEVECVASHSWHSQNQESF